MKIRLYTLNENTGFAPCHSVRVNGRYRQTELLTLANCMADMRNAVAIGEWVAAITPNRMTNRLAFLMHVDGTFTRAEYWNSFQGSRIDCIYRPDTNSPYGFKQMQNPWHEPDDQRRDMKSSRILWSREFFWFAQSYDHNNTDPQGLVIPDEYCALKRSRRSMYGTFIEVPDAFIEWAKCQPTLCEFSVIDGFEGETSRGQCGDRPKSKSVAVSHCSS